MLIDESMDNKDRIRNLMTRAKTTKLQLVSSKINLNIEIIAITDLKMTVEWLVNMTKPFYDEINLY